jgi:transposase
LADLPWEGIAVRVRLQVRRFFCQNDACQQAIFCERLPEIAERYARQTIRLNQVFRHFGLTVGGEGGTNAASGMGISISADTLLRRVQSTPQTEITTPKVLGVDDWAKRKGQSCGTILVDLEKHRVIDILPDRQSGTLAGWLKQHPGVEMISRDRAGAYANGARQGAPDAIQIADRWHIHKNLTEAVERALQTKQGYLRQAAKQAHQELAPKIISPDQTSEPELSGKLALWNDRRQQRYQEVRDLWERGMTIRRIAEHFGMHRRTIRMYVKSESCPERLSPRKRSSQLDRHFDYLAQRWSEGCHNSAEMYRELRDRGYCGSESLVRHAVARWRDQLPPELKRARRGPAVEKPASGRKKQIIPSARQTAWLLLQKEEKLEPEQKVYLAQLGQLSPEIEELQRLGHRFSRILREKRAKEFESWIKDAFNSSFPEMKAFANGLIRDREAVEASLAYQWSNGQTEGQVNRLKTLKREMYGRAKFDLLKTRMLGAQRL